jgi:hypothetical protein
MEHYMKILGIVIISVALMVGCKTGSGSDASDESGIDGQIPEAGEEDYSVGDYAPVFKMWEAFEAPFTDADKTRNGDGKMCWAAAAANIITWAGWSVDEDEVFEIFKTRFDNQTGYIYKAMLYYFRRHIGTMSAAAVTVRETRSHLAMDFIVSKLHEGNGVVIFIQGPGIETGHYLSVFGYRYYSQTDDFLLYFTDSDDHWHQMRNTKLYWDEEADKWKSQSQDWHLEYAISLARN